MHPIICLMGPTASGKTELAINLIQDFPMEIISVDSVMVYRGMNIGSAKPSPETLNIAPHKLINIRDAKEAYSAAQFRHDVLIEIKNIQSQKKLPLLVGGTMLYFRALQLGLSNLPSADNTIRKKLNEEASVCGWPAMHARLAELDPIAAKRIHPNDAQRIQRALEVCLISGKSLTQGQQKQEIITDYTFHNLIIAPAERSVLHKRIEDRFRQMLREGLIDEVKNLFARGDLSLNDPAIRAVGYRQVWEYLENKISFDEMVERGIAATRQLAKRQLTWLRTWPNATWFNSEDSEVYLRIKEYIKTIISK